MQKTEIVYGLQQLQAVLKKQVYSSIHVVVDENTLRLCYPLVKPLLPAHTLIETASGESHKSLNTCRHIWEELTANNADRSAVLINLGGGVIGDMGGFAAACYKRGIDFIQAPTTLLSMVDASVGGKTGIDFMGFKNQVGAFAMPAAIIIETAFLETLPERELTAGLAEVIKHYLVADKAAFENLSGHRPPLRNFDWPQLVKRNIEIKAAIVEQDPHEQGMRKALNFGHTIGHAVESFLLNDEDRALLHGEAVALGMVAEAFISMKMHFITEQELKEITALIFHYFELPVFSEAEFGKVLNLVKQDKKNKMKMNQFTLLKGIGGYSINNYVNDELLHNSLRFYNLQLA